jgi:hypothetical protein
MAIDKYETFKQGIYIEKMTPFLALLGLARQIQPVTTLFELIRVGGEADGGYLVPDDLSGIAVCFSPGVEDIAGFERDLLSTRGINSHMADYSVDGPPMGFQPQSFTKKYLGATDDPRFMTLDSWVRGTPEFHSQADLLLQMDIEGAEYVCLLGVSEEVLKRFRIMVVEFHDVEAWGQPHFFGIVAGLFTRLSRYFHVVHNHPNNCCGLVDLGGFLAPRVFELTFLRRDRTPQLGLCQAFPHPFDRPNVRDRAELMLPRHWYNQPVVARGT